MEPTQPPSDGNQWTFLWEYGARLFNLTTHLHVELSLRIRGAEHPFPPPPIFVAQREEPFYL